MQDVLDGFPRNYSSLCRQARNNLKRFGSYGEFVGNLGIFTKHKKNWISSRKKKLPVDPGSWSTMETLAQNVRKPAEALKKELSDYNPESEHISTLNALIDAYTKIESIAKQNAALAKKPEAVAHNHPEQSSSLSQPSTSQSSTSKIPTRSAGKEPNPPQASTAYPSSAHSHGQYPPTQAPTQTVGQHRHPTADTFEHLLPSYSQQPVARQTTASSSSLYGALGPVVPPQRSILPANPYSSHTPAAYWPTQQGSTQSAPEYSRQAGGRQDPTSSSLPYVALSQPPQRSSILPANPYSSHTPAAYWPTQQGSTQSAPEYSQWPVESHASYTSSELYGAVDPSKVRTRIRTRAEAKADGQAQGHAGPHATGSSSGDSTSSKTHQRKKSRKSKIGTGQPRK